MRLERSYSAAFGMYPAYLAKTDRVTTLQERIQQCFRFSLNGFPPPLDSHDPPRVARGLAPTLVVDDEVPNGEVGGVDAETDGSLAPS